MQFVAYVCNANSTVGREGVMHKACGWDAVAYKGGWSTWSERVEQPALDIFSECRFFWEREGEEPEDEYAG